MSRKSSAEKGYRSASVEPGCLTGRAHFPWPATILIGLLIGSATPIFIGPILAGTPPPVSINGVFDSDLADVKPAALPAIKDAAAKAKASEDGCYPPTSATFTAQIKSANDASFEASLGKVRADALQQTLASLGYAQGQVKTGYAIGSADNVQVNYDKPGKDADAPRLKVTSTPPKGTKVKAGDKIHMTIIASERYADGHKSWPTGVRSIQLTSNDGMIDSKDYGVPPQPCARQTLETSYTVPSNPPEIIHLHVIAVDGAGNRHVEDGDFPTTGDYFGTVQFKSQQAVPTGMQYFTGSMDIVLKLDGKGNLTGSLSGTQSEKLTQPSCPSDTITPGRVTAKLNGVLKDTTISLDVSDGTATPPIMTPCPKIGRPPSTAPAVYTWPHFALVFHELPKRQNGSYHFDQEWTNPGGGFPFTEHYALQLDPVK